MMKKVFALCAVVLVLAVGILPAFASELPLPTYPQSNINLSSVTRQDANNIVSIVTDMRRVGTLNSLRPLFVRRLTTGTIALYCCQQIYNPAVDLTGENVNIGNLSVYQFYLTREGFSFNSYIGQVVVPSNQVIASFSSSGASINTAYSFGDGDANVTIIEAKAYWEQYALRLATDSSSALQGAYNSGFEAGYNSGYADGTDEGYDIAYDDGYADGESAGRATGYSDGYTVGYTEGYDAGAGASGMVLDVPAIFDGIFSGANSILKGIDIELFGINVLGVLIAILVIAIVAFVVRKLWK